MFGFVAERDNAVVVANRLFEMKLYNLFLSEEEMEKRPSALKLHNSKKIW